MSQSVTEPQRVNTDQPDQSSSESIAYDLMSYPGGFQTTYETGEQASLAVKIVGPLLLVLVGIVVVYIVVSFILFRIERQIRRRSLEKQSTASASSLQRAVKRRMLAYALPYNVLDFKKAAESQSRSQTWSSDGPSVCGTVRGRIAEEDQFSKNSLVEISERRRPSEKTVDLQELVVPVSKIHSAGSAMETRFLEQALHRKDGVAKVRSPVKQTKYLLKKMKHKRIRPFNNKEEKPRRREDELSEDGFSSSGSGVLFISDSFDLDSDLSTTSTFRMKLDQV